MGKYFGTDGFRGNANENLTADHAYKVGRFLGWYYGELKRRSGDDTPARIVIGKDTRRSSYMFEYSLVGGLTSSGADAYLLHVTTTPSVAYISRVDSFDCGIMISASHNPYHDNGIKLINGNGEKMEDSVIELVEAYLDGRLEAFGEKFTEIPFATGAKIGRSVDYISGRNRYVGYLISLGLSFFVPKIYTAIAFDSGGVASGPLTSSFILPLAIGACAVLCGEKEVLNLAFGIVAMVAMTPLITIQLLGFRAVATAKVKHKIVMRRILDADDEQIINFM